MFELTVRGHFDAAHRLVGYEGKCRNLHGHRWEVALTVEAEELDDLGMACDFGLMKGVLHEQVLDVLDHGCLNDQAPFDVENPTAEKIARWAFERCKGRFGPNGRLRSVTVWEAPDAWVRYGESTEA